MSLDEIRATLGSSGVVSQWQLESEVMSWGYEEMPSGNDLYDSLTEDDPIEWSRFSAFQDVSLRLIVERVLRKTSPRNHQRVYLQGEVEVQPIRLKRPPRGKFHVFCSEHNFGATDLLDELRAAFPVTLKGLAVTSDVRQMADCSHCLIYLTRRTWSSGAASARFAHEVALALAAGVHLQLVHESPSLINVRERFACEFGDLLDGSCHGPDSNRQARGTSLFMPLAIPCFRTNRL